MIDGLVKEAAGARGVIGGKSGAALGDEALGLADTGMVGDGSYLAALGWQQSHGQEDDEKQMQIISIRL